MKPLLIAALLATAWATPGCAAKPHAVILAAGSTPAPCAVPSDLQKEMECWTPPPAIGTMVCRYKPDSKWDNEPCDKHNPLLITPGPFDRPIPMCRYDARGLETPLPHKPFSCIPSPPPTPTPRPR